VPDINTFPADGINMSRSDLQKLFEVRPGEWQGEIQDIKGFLDTFGSQIPYEIRNDFNRLSSRLQQPAAT
jgi:GTP-dependent phosphoenolpyruvate carboxykinase